MCEEDYFAFSCQIREALAPFPDRKLGLATNREASAEFFTIKQRILICQILVMMNGGKKVNICTFGLDLAVSSVLIEAVKSFFNE